MSCQIFHEDCFAFLRSLPSESVDLILTDPPYGIQYQNCYTKKRYRVLNGDCGIDYQLFAQECYRVLRNNRHAYLFTRFDRYPSHFLHLQKAGFQIKNCLVIEKGTVGGIGDLKGSFSCNAEWIIFCQKGRREFQQTELVRNNRRFTKPYAKSRKPVPEYKTRFPACWFGELYPKATYNASWQHQHGILHPTAKNDICLEWLIRISTIAEELVMDPFLGSGSTAVAAQNAQRRFIGCENDISYVLLAKKRVEGG